MINIEDHIPFGNENKVSLDYLAEITGLDKRVVRQEIANARNDRRVLIIPNGGYFRPRVNDTTDTNLLQTFIAKEVKRMHALIMDVGNYTIMEREFLSEAKQIPGQMEMELING